MSSPDEGRVIVTGCAICGRSAVCRYRHVGVDEIYAWLCDGCYTEITPEVAQ